jgi:hypothetical protein
MMPRRSSEPEQQTVVSREDLNGIQDAKTNRTGGEPKKVFIDDFAAFDRQR